MLLVTLPEATPVHEAAALQEDLRRAQIEPFAWVINQSLLHSGSCDPLLQCREEAEHRYMREVAEKESTPDGVAAVASGRADRPGRAGAARHRDA